MDLFKQCRREVIDLHQFFERWFNGRQPQDRSAIHRLEEALAAEFHIITPDAALMDRDEIVERVYSSWGFAQEDAERIVITVESIELRKITHEDVAILTYEEWHQRAGRKRGRISSAMMRPSATAPNGVEWLHVHEAWIGQATSPDVVG